MDRTFIKECEQWLEPLNYRVHSCSADHTKCTLINTEKIDDFPHYPIIKCWIDENEKKYCSIEHTVYNSIFMLSSGTLEFNHLKIKEFVEEAKLYIERIMEDSQFLY